MRKHRIQTSVTDLSVSGIAKGRRMEYIIQKSVELGVHEIIPVAMKYCVVKLDAKKQVTR